MQFLTCQCAVAIVRERGICSGLRGKRGIAGMCLYNSAGVLRSFLGSPQLVRLGIRMLLDGVKHGGVMPESFAGRFTGDFLST